MKMKVMLFGTVLENANIPAKQQLSLIYDGLKEFKQDSRTEELYGFAGEWGGVLLCNVDSGLELDEYISLNPMSQVVKWEAHNVSTLDDQISIMEKLIKHQKAQKAA
jgi:hypothetical protein